MQLKGMSLDVAVKKISLKIMQYVRNRIRRYRVLAVPIRLDTSLLAGFQSHSQYLFHVNDRLWYVECIKAFEQERATIKDADRICLHQFNLLGSGEVQLGEKLPWNEDFKTHDVWKNRFYKDIQIINLKNAADVKVPWELSRCQHFFTLGKAYWLTSNEKYAKEFQDQLDDWIVQNPVEMSVNWTCTMDVAIRAVNWIAGIQFFLKSSSISSSFWERVNTSLYLHGQFIMNNLENTGEHTGNHYLTNLVGLIELGIYFGEFKITGRRNSSNDPQTWLQYGLAEIERELFVQVNNDGSNYEASTSYHRLVTECFLYMTVLCVRNEIHFSEVYRNRLEKMCEFILQTLKPSGLTPVIGDADDGRLLIVSNYGSWIRNDSRYLLAVAGEFFDRNDFRYGGRHHQEDALWITGRFTPVVDSFEPVLQSIAYPDGGYYVLRNERVYCLIRCGELSFHGQGGHSHNDQLSFELQIDGLDVIIDPGTYVYTADYRKRNLFRSTAMHNTIEVDGKEQNDFDELVLFLMREQTFANCEIFDANHFVGSHEGYVKKSGVIHQRAFHLSDNELEIIDVLKQVESLKDVDLSYYASYILAPGVEVIQHEKHVELRHQHITIELSTSAALEIEIHNCWVSSQYGVREWSRLIRIKGSEPMLHTFIRW